MELQSSLTYVSDYSHPKLENTSDSIARNNEEISKQATSLIRLIKKIQTDRTPLIGIDKITQRIVKKMQSNLELWDIYHRNNKEDSLAFNEELKSVLKDREILLVRKKIGDICDKEYRLKLASVNWDIMNLHKKKLQLEKRITTLNSLRDQLDPGDIDEIRWHAQDDYKTIRELKLGKDVCDMVINNVTTITRIIA